MAKLEPKIGPVQNFELSKDSTTVNYQNSPDSIQEAPSSNERDEDDLVHEALIDRANPRDQLSQTGSSITPQSWTYGPNQAWQGHWQYYGWGTFLRFVGPIRVPQLAVATSDQEIRPVDESQQRLNVQETWTMSKYRRNLSQYESFVFKYETIHQRRCKKTVAKKTTQATQLGESPCNLPLPHQKQKARVRQVHLGDPAYVKMLQAAPTARRNSG